MIDHFLDTLWLKIVALFTILGNTLFSLTTFLHPLGSALTITTLAFLTVCLTKLLNRLITTKRYTELEKNFHKWKELREQVNQFEDQEKGKRMARNIDQAELNKAYYDYFFEGLLLGMARKVIPIILIIGFINEYYNSEQLGKLFGHTYAISIPSTKEPILAGATFWYFISLLGGYILWPIAGKLLRRRKA